MIELFNGDVVIPTSQRTIFKAKITTGTASIQAQAVNEGYDTITNGYFTQTIDGELNIKECQLKIVLTGDARFFMSSVIPVEV